MSEKYKVGLCRNRLFEFDNAVVFCGKLADCDEGQLSKAVKLLCLKEPVLTAVAELCGNGECYLETEAVVQKLVLSELTADEVRNDFFADGLVFDKKLFEFVLSKDGYLIIGAHTLVADCKSLLRLARELIYFYENGNSSVEPSRIESFSDITALPMEVNSPLTDKLSAELDSGWQKKACVSDVTDYLSAKRLYDEKRKYSREFKIALDSDCTAELKAFCGEKNVDLSSVVAFAFYKTLYEEMNPQKRHGKVCVHADRRLFLQGAEASQVGAFNGFCEASLSNKERKLPVDEQIKAFHLSCYKGVTSPFKTFYDEVLLMKVSPSYCDSAYMFLSGAFNDKASRKLAQNYGCMNEQLCEFFSCNLDQEYWRELKKYKNVCVTEPLKNRFAANVSFIVVDGACEITVKFNNSRMEASRCEAVVCEIERFLKNIK